MSGRDSTQSLLVLRKLTRAITDVVRAQMVEYLATLTPLFRPTSVLGDYVQGRAERDDAKGREGVISSCRICWTTRSERQSPELPRELTPPLNFPGSTLEITPHEYAHIAHSGTDAKTIMVRPPLTGR